MVLLALTTEWPLRRPHDASQSHHSDSELYKAIRNTNVTPTCVCADLAASMRSRWERGLPVQDFIPWLSYPCSAKIHTWGLLFFFFFVCFGWFFFFCSYGAKDTLGRNELNNCSTMSEWCFIWLILMELHLPSSCMKATEVIPVADEDKGFFLPLQGLEAEQAWQSNNKGL